MKMKLQCDEMLMSQVTTWPFRRGEMHISHSQMRYANFPLERHPNARRAGTAASVSGWTLRMEEFGSVGFSVEASEGGLKELVRRWFTDTQASHILHDGTFPDWFQSFAARK